MDLTPEELENLSDEEREAILGEKDEDDEIVASIAADDDNTPDDDDDNTPPADEPAPTPTNQDPAPEPAPAPAAEFTPELRADMPENATERLAEIKTAADELLKKFEDGEIDAKAFMAQKEVLDQQSFDIKMAVQQAEFAQRQNAEARTQRWEYEQERFFGQEANGMYKDPVMFAALNAQVKALGQDAANANRAPHWYLEEADRLVRDRFAIGAKAPTGDKPSGNNKPTPPDLSKVPKTLANIPAAELPDTGNAEFAHLDKLDGMDLEMALAKLSPEQADRYLKMAA